MASSRETRYKITADGKVFEATIQSLEKGWIGFKKELASGVTFGGGFAIGTKLAETLIDTVKAIPNLMADSVAGIAAFGSELTDLGAKTKLSVGFLQELKFSGSLVGVSMQEAANGVVRMQKAIGEGSGAFARMGLDVAKLKAMKPEAAFESVAQAISEIRNPSEQAAAAMAVFGKSGADLLPLLNDLPALREEFKKLGIELSGETVAAADKLDDEFTKLGAVWDNVKMSIGEAFLPKVTQGVQELSAFIASNKEEILRWVDGAINIASAAFTVLSKSISLVAGAFRMTSTAAEAFFGTLNKGLGTSSLVDQFVAQQKGGVAGGVSDGSIVGDLVARNNAGPGTIDSAFTRALPTRKGVIQGAFDRAVPSFMGPPAPGAGRSFDPEAEEKAKRAAAAAKKAADEAHKAAAAFREMEKDVDDAMSADASDAFLESQREIEAEARAVAEEHAAWAGVMDDLALDQKAAEMDELREQEIAAARATFDWRQELAGLAGTFSSLGGVGNLLGSVAGGISSIASQMKGLGGLSGLKGMLTGKGGIGGIFAGLSGAMSLGGAALGIGKSIFGALTSSPAEKAAKEAGKILGMKVSEDMGKEILARSKELGTSVKSAALLALPDMMGKSGKDASSFGGQAMDLLRGIQSGSVPARQGLESLSKAFTLIKDEALAAGRIGDAAFTNLIRGARDASGKIGDQFKDIQGFVREQLSSAASGVGAGVTGIKVSTPEDMRAQATIATTTFWAVFKEEGLLAASDAFAGISETLRKSMEGIGGDAAAQAILGPMDALVSLGQSDAFRGPVEGALGMSKALEGLVNSAIPMSVDQFSAFGQQAQAAFQQASAAAMEQGMSAADAQKNAFLAIGPLLGNLQKGAAAYGVELDANTQSLIHQAQAAGVAFPADSTDRLRLSIDALTSALGGVPPKFQEIGMAAGTATTASAQGMEALGTQFTTTMVTAGQVASSAAVTAAVAWQGSAASQVTAIAEAAGPMKANFDDIAIFGAARGEFVSQEWKRAGGEIGLFIADSVPEVEDAFFRLSEAATDPLMQVRRLLDAVGGAASGASSAVDGLGAALDGLPGGPTIPSGGGGGGVDSSGLPHHAEGGVVEPTPGGSLHVVGEGGEREFIIPESKMPGGVSIGNVNITVPSHMSSAQAEEFVARAITRVIAQNRGGARTAMTRGVSARRGG